MKSNHISILLAGVLSGVGMMAGSDLLAQEKPMRPHASPPAEAKERADNPEAGKIRRMMQEMRELQHAGKHEDARRMAGKIQEATGNDPRVGEAVRKTMRDQKPEPKSDKRADKPKDREAKPATAAGGKIRHLNQAAEHLQAAGYEEYAARARAESRRMAAELQQTEAAAKSREKEVARDVRPGDGASIMDEMNRLRREMEELRREVMRLKASAGPRPPAGPPGENRPWMERRR